METGEIIKLIGIVLVMVGPGIAKALQEAQKKRAAEQRRSFDPGSEPPPQRERRPERRVASSPARPPQAVRTVIPVDRTTEPRIRRPTSPARPTPTPTLAAPPRQRAPLRPTTIVARAAESDLRPRAQEAAGIFRRTTLDGLRRAIVFSEVLGPPVSDRPDRF